LYIMSITRPDAGCNIYVQLTHTCEVAKSTNYPIIRTITMLGATASSLR